MENKIYKGIVKWFNTDKLYGFIKDDNSDAEYFFHRMNQIDITAIIKQNDKVTFDIMEDTKSGKIRANKVLKIANG